MTVAIAGMGWVTPLGSGVRAVWERLLRGEEAVAEELSSPLRGERHCAYRVPASATAEAPAHPRLRRSSAISRFAVVAGLAALEDAGVVLDGEIAQRSALIFAISNGGVVYTKRFYHDIVETGAQAASPLLFPETVFNAPASHLAAILGITGASYTLVGDGAVGLLAIKMGEDLMHHHALDYCLVIGAEEVDWLLCDAYRKWRLARTAPPIEPFRQRQRGMIPSEGAGAILLSREGFAELERTDGGGNFARQREAAELLDGIYGRLSAPSAPDLVVASANGTFVDDAEGAAIVRHCPSVDVYTPKPALGESVGAGGIWQVICAAQAIRSRSLPPVLHADAESELRLSSHGTARREFQTALVSACGLNQQAAGLRLRARA